jgi:hypothetical protein
MECIFKHLKHNIWLVSIKSPVQNKFPPFVHFKRWFSRIYVYALETHIWRWNLNCQSNSNVRQQSLRKSCRSLNSITDNSTRGRDWQDARNILFSINLLGIYNSIYYLKRFGSCHAMIVSHTNLLPCVYIKI